MIMSGRKIGRNCSKRMVMVGGGLLAIWFGLIIKKNLGGIEMRKFIRRWLGIDDMAYFQAEVIRDLKSDVVKLIEHIDKAEMNIEHLRFRVKGLPLPPVDIDEIRGNSIE